MDRTSTLTRDAPDGAVADPIVAFRDYSGGFRQRHSDQVTPILSGIDLTFRRGALTAVVGETGSGKTMLALSIIGLTASTFACTGGRVELDGRDVTSLDERAYRAIRGRDVAMVFQDSRTALNPVFTIGRQLIDVVRLHHVTSRRAARTRAVELLQQMRVPEPRRRMGQYPHELSGGTAQRVQLAIALACEPMLLLLDEPTTGLDLTVQAEVLELITDLIHGGSLSAVLITHDMGVVAQTCDDVVVLRHGVVCETGPVSSVLTDPTHPYTAELVAASRTQAGTR